METSASGWASMRYFYVEASKVVQRRMEPNFKKSFERAVRTARC